MSDTALRLSGVTKAFAGHTAVADLSLVIPRGSVFGLLGPNGAGKTTTLRMVMNILGPDSGTHRDPGPALRPCRARPHRLHARRARPLPPHGPRRAALVHGRDQGHEPGRGRSAHGPLARAPGPRGLAQEEGQRALQGHAAEGAVHRHRAARARGADPRRAHERPRPRGHGPDARGAPRPEAAGQDPRPVEPSDGDGGAALRPGGPHPQGPEDSRRDGGRREAAARQEHAGLVLRRRRLVPREPARAWPR